MVVRNILGFQQGYIWIYKGDLEAAEYWFIKSHECRYHVFWGWYTVSTQTIPSDIPSCIEPVQLPWDKIGNPDGTLLPKDIVTKVVNSLRFDASPSVHQGQCGDRLERKVTLIKVTDLGQNQYGGSNRIYTFEDTDRNIYTWTTAVKKDWDFETPITIRGTVKSHTYFNGAPQTELQRVMERKN